MSFANTHPALTGIVNSSWSISTTIKSATNPALPEKIILNEFISLVINEICKSISVQNRKSMIDHLHSKSVEELKRIVIENDFTGVLREAVDTMGENCASFLRLRF